MRTAIHIGFGFLVENILREIVDTSKVIIFNYWFTDGMD